MEKQGFMESLGFDVANPRFYDRLNAVCTVFLVIALLGLVFLFIRDQPRLDPAVSSGIIHVEGVGPISDSNATVVAAPAHEIAAKS